MNIFQQWWQEIITALVPKKATCPRCFRIISLKEANSNNGGICHNCYNDLYKG